MLQLGCLCAQSAAPRQAPQGASPVRAKGVGLGGLSFIPDTRLNSTHSPPWYPCHTRLCPARCPRKHPVYVLGTSLRCAPVSRGCRGQCANSEGDSLWLCLQPDESPSLSLISGKGQDCGAELRPGYPGQAGPAACGSSPAQPAASRPCGLLIRSQGCPQV